eukprot:763885-Hanusia_phi.AAC.2
MRSDCKLARPGSKLPFYPLRTARCESGLPRLLSVPYLLFQRQRRHERRSRLCQGLLAQSCSILFGHPPVVRGPTGVQPQSISAAPQLASSPTHPCSTRVLPSAPSSTAPPLPTDCALEHPGAALLCTTSDTRAAGSHHRSPTPEADARRSCRDRSARTAAFSAPAPACCRCRERKV